MTSHARGSSTGIEEELAQIRRYEDFSTTGKKIKKTKKKVDSCKKAINKGIYRLGKRRYFRKISTIIYTTPKS